MKPIEYEDDPMQKSTQDSIATAEQQLGAKLDLPKKDHFYDLHLQPNVSSHPDFKYEEDHDISDTLDSIKTSETLYGYRNQNRWSHWNRYGNNTNDGYNYNPAYAYGYQGHDTPANKDWWNQLRKDNGESGMEPVHIKFDTKMKSEEYGGRWWKDHGYKDRWGNW